MSRLGLKKSKVLLFGRCNQRVAFELHDRQNMLRINRDGRNNTFVPFPSLFHIAALHVTQLIKADILAVFCHL